MRVFCGRAIGRKSNTRVAKGARGSIVITKAISMVIACVRDDLLDACMDQVEEGFDKYLQHNNGNPLVYDTVIYWIYSKTFAPVV